MKNRSRGFGVARTLSFGLGLFLCACQSGIDATARRLDEMWSAPNAEVLSEKGSQTFAQDFQAVFEATRLALLDLELVVESQDLASGFIFASGTAPAPLSQEEWDEVRKAHSSDLRSAAMKSMGPLGALTTFTTKGVETLLSVRITEIDDEVSVTATYRLRHGNPEAGHVTQAPPKALDIGLDKLWVSVRRHLQP